VQDTSLLPNSGETLPAANQIFSGTHTELFAEGGREMADIPVPHLGGCFTYAHAPPFQQLLRPLHPLFDNIGMHGITEHLLKALLQLELIEANDAGEAG
jgi:hypothetical protein